VHKVKCVYHSMGCILYWVHGVQCRIFLTSFNISPRVAVFITVLGYVSIIVPIYLYRTRPERQSKSRLKSKWSGSLVITRRSASKITTCLLLRWLQPQSTPKNYVCWFAISSRTLLFSSLDRNQSSRALSNSSDVAWATMQLFILARWALHFHVAVIVRFLAHWANSWISFAQRARTRA